MSLKGKVALVVGGANGIGKASSLKIASKGANIAVCDLDFESSKNVAQDIESMGRKAIPVKVDVTVNDQVKEMTRITLNKFKKIDILVYCPGYYPPLRRLTEIPEEEVDRVFDINFKGFFRCCKSVVPEMIKNKGGKIISISSMSGVMGKRTTYALMYGSAKAALNLFTKAAARELASYNINVNTVCPTIIWTHMGRRASEFMEKFSTKERGFQKFKGFSPKEVFDKFVEENIPLKRAPTPEDIANAVLFLASEGSKNITGQAIAIDGGADA